MPIPSSRWRIRRAARSAGSGSSWGATVAPVGAEHGEHGVLVVVERAGRAAAEARDGLGDPQRMARADRLAQLDVVDHARGQRQRARPQAVDPAGVILEDVDQLGVELRGRVGEHEKAARELSGPQPEVVGAGRRPGLGELDERADDRRDEQPLALGDPAGIDPQRSGGGQRGAQTRRAIADLHGLVLARPRLGQLGAADP